MRWGCELTDQMNINAYVGAAVAAAEEVVVGAAVVVTAALVVVVAAGALVVVVWVAAAVVVVVASVVVAALTEARARAAMRIRERMVKSKECNEWKGLKEEEMKKYKKAVSSEVKIRDTTVMRFDWGGYFLILFGF
jgi:hypothetical protein